MPSLLFSFADYGNEHLRKALALCAGAMFYRRRMPLIKLAIWRRRRQIYRALATKELAVLFGVFRDENPPARSARRSEISVIGVCQYDGVQPSRESQSLPRQRQTGRALETKESAVLFFASYEAYASSMLGSFCVFECERRPPDRIHRLLLGEKAFYLSAILFFRYFLHFFLLKLCTPTKIKTAY